MTQNFPTAVRAFIIYAICIVVALVLGFMLASPTERASFFTIGIIFAVLATPLLLKFHHPLLVLGWNSTMIVFFLPGTPGVWLPLIFISLTLSLVRRSIDPGYRFIGVRELTIPLIVLALVILITAEATGGIKFRSLGGDVYGGKRYIFMIGAIIGYFALTAQSIPRKFANLYIGLFLLGAATSLIGDVFYFDNPALHFLYLFFPPNVGISQSSSGITRFGGVAQASAVFFSFMLARFGIRNILTLRHPWRFLLLIAFGLLGLIGGFRSVFVTMVGVSVLQFFLEGLHRTRLFPFLIIGVILFGTATLPFVRQMPYNVQRALAVLPIDVDPVVRMDAENSSEWRIKLWKALLPQIPKYLLLGKGFALTPEDYDYSFNNFTGSMGAISEDQGWAGLAGDYHNGPLSVLIIFGLWGAIGFIWFLAAGLHVLYRNYRFGDPALKSMNTFLFAIFIVRVLMFFAVVGGIQFDLISFTGYLGISVALNGGVAKRPPAPDTAPQPAPEPVLPWRSAQRP